MYRNNSYRKFKIPKTHKRQKIPFNFPKRCVVCNDQNVSNYYEYREKKSLYLDIPLCEDHLKILKNKPFTKKILIILLISVVLSFIIGFILLFSQNSSIIIFIVIFNVGLWFFFIFCGTLKQGRMNRIIGKIHENITVGEDKYSYTVSIKNEVIFLEGHPKDIKEVQVNQKAINIHERKFKKGLISILLWCGINVPLWIIIGLFIPLDLFKILFYFAFIIPLYLLFMNSISHSMKVGKLKTSQLPPEKKICFYLLFGFIFLIITLGYFRS